MIKGIGTDIVEIDRIKSAIERLGDKFVQRILTVNEQQIFQEHHQPIAYLAKRFAAKEAVAKALGTGIAKGVGFQQIETFNEASGEPKVRLMDSALELQSSKGVTHIHLSLSDEQRYAVAYVVLEGR